MKSAPACMATMLGLRDGAQRLEVAGRQDGFQMGVAAGLAHRRHLVVERRPIAEKRMRPGDHDVDLARALGQCVADLLEPLRPAASGPPESRSRPRPPGMPEPRSTLTAGATIVG